MGESALVSNEARVGGDYALGFWTVVSDKGRVSGDWVIIGFCGGGVTLLVASVGCVCWAFRVGG